MEEIERRVQAQRQQALAAAQLGGSGTAAAEAAGVVPMECAAPDGLPASAADAAAAGAQRAAPALPAWQSAAVRAELAAGGDVDMQEQEAELLVLPVTPPAQRTSAAGGALRGTGWQSGVGLLEEPEADWGAQAGEQQQRQQQHRQRRQLPRRLGMGGMQLALQ